ncbi:MAG: ADP-ribosylation factor-like protein, partial [Candidatus Hodarchaeota archaeon]
KQTTATVALVGLENAGKTSFLKRMRTGKFQTTVPTYGMNAETIHLPGGQWINVFDIGGQEPFRELLWQPYVSQAHAVIFILDSADSSKFREANRWFWKVSNWVPRGSPILTLANKSDLENRVGLEEISKQFGFEAFERTIEKPMKLFQTSIITGEGVEAATTWLANQLLARPCNIHELHLYQNNINRIRLKFGPLQPSKQIIKELLLRINEEVMKKPNTTMIPPITVTSDKYSLFAAWKNNHCILLVLNPGTKSFERVKKIIQVLFSLDLNVENSLLEEEFNKILKEKFANDLYSDWSMLPTPTNKNQNKKSMFI